VAAAGRAGDINAERFALSGYEIVTLRHSCRLSLIIMGNIPLALIGIA
jgi:hypothetical protein